MPTVTLSLANQVANRIPSVKTSSVTSMSQIIDVSMEARLIAIEEKLIKVLEALRMLQEKNANLWRRVAELDNTNDHTHDEHVVGETQYDLKVNREHMEKKMICDELKEMAGKYEEMGKRIGGPSPMQNLLNQIDLPYNEWVIATPVQPKFKVPQVDIYNGSRDLVDHLENFKVHIVLHGFVGEIAC